MIQKFYPLLQDAALSYTSKMSDFLDSPILGLVKKLFYSPISSLFEKL